MRIILIVIASLVLFATAASAQKRCTTTYNPTTNTYQTHCF